MLEEPDLVVLARVIDRGSFAAAGDELRIPPSTLSRRIAALEKRLGVRVLERTTRRLRATEIGEILATRGRRVRTELEDAERDAADHRETPRGVLRVALPTPSGDFLGPVFTDLLARYPEIRLELALSDAPIDLLAQGYDVAVHGGRVTANGSYGVTRVGTISPVLAAAQRYLDRAPPIHHPRDLADPAHTVIARSRRSTWDFTHGKSGRELTITPSPARVVTTAKSLRAALVAEGIGLAFVPRVAALASPGVRILEPAGYRPTGGPFSLVTPSAGATSRKVRAFADALRGYVAARPDLFR